MKVKAPLQNLPKNPALTATNQSLGLTDTIISVLHWSAFTSSVKVDSRYTGADFSKIKK